MHKLLGCPLINLQAAQRGRVWVGVLRGPVGTHPGEVQRIKYTLSKRVN